MKKEELLKLGLTEDQANAALVMHGMDIESRKVEVETLQTENQALHSQVQEATETIEGFKKLDVDGIQTAAEEWKSKAEEAEEAAKLAREEADEKVLEMQFTQTLKDALIAGKAKNPIAVSALLDYDKLEFTPDGTITGLDEQLKVLQEENDYMFNSDKEMPRIVTGGQNHSVISDGTVDAARKAAGLPPLKE